MIRSYNEMMQFESFEERLKYLQLYKEKHTSPRSISPAFYKSSAWLQLRKFIIERDYSSDLGILGLGIGDHILVHHINPLSESDLRLYDERMLLDPNNLITVSYDTHNKIHYSPRDYSVSEERKPGDTKLW